MRLKHGFGASRLEEHGGKRSHWAWWVFPTDRVGQNDPYKTCLVDSEVAKLFDNSTREEER